MLIEFRVANHRSIREEQVLSFEAGRVGEPDDPVVREVGGVRLLPAIALYGANASGKSNVLSAFSFMRQAVALSHRRWEPDGGVPRNPFAWVGGEEPSLFEATVVLEGVRHRYGFVADDERVVEEWLHAWPHGRKQVWFERDGGTFKFGEHLKGENKLIERVTRHNALYLSAATQHANAQLEPLFRWFAGSRTVGLGSRTARPPWALSPGSHLVRALDAERHGRTEADIASWLPAFRELLSAADVGIADFRLDSTGDAMRRHAVKVRHITGSDDSWLDLRDESGGTLTLFQAGPTLLHALAQGRLVVVDELESSLHPLLAQRIVDLFNNPATNPRGAQLLFTTHDTNLLGTATGTPALRRDQVWLTEKDDTGATVLYPLTDFKPRKSENLERGYLMGRYGAIPFLGELDLGLAE